MKFAGFLREVVRARSYLLARARIFHSQDQRFKEAIVCEKGSKINLSYIKNSLGSRFFV